VSEIQAQKKFECPACGAEARWDPGKESLICPFCGTTSPAQVQITSTGEQVVQEHDLATALRGLSDDRRGWQAQKTSVQCQSCQAISVFDAERVGQRCEFCGSTALVPYEEIKQAIRPESLLPMKLAESQVRDIIRHWYRSRWFAPNKLKSQALTDTVHGLYIPYWTFDARVQADWTAESGYYYYTTETYRDSQGHTKTRQVRHVRWQPSAGSLNHVFDDELVSASKGVDPTLLQHIEPFPTQELTSYNPGFLAGWVVERYQIDLVAAAGRAREKMLTETRQRCAAEVPGDTHRNLQVRTQFSEQTFKHILVPIWLLSYDYGSRHFQAVINGYTGTVAGQYPKSWLKITLAVLGLIGIIGTIVLLANR
jgi:hypothetical protein